MRALGLFLAGFGLGYLAIERAGLASLAPPSTVDALHSSPFLVFSFAVLLYSAAAVAVSGRGGRRPNGRILLVPVVLLVAGLWISYLTGFNAEFVITEGQSIDMQGLGNRPGGALRGKYATPPALDVTLEKLDPEFDEGKTGFRSLRGRLLVRDKRRNEPSETVIGDSFPRLIGGYWMKFSGFGYSPRYVLKSAEGKVLDSSFVYMDVFPPGREDYFRLLSPVTYHLRYLPDERDGKGDRRLHLRIVRNKEILLNRGIGLGEEVSFENGLISFPEVRMWSRLSVWRDMGVVPASLGLLVLLSNLIRRALRGTPRAKGMGHRE